MEKCHRRGVQTHDANILSQNTCIIILTQFPPSRRSSHPGPCFRPGSRPFFGHWLPPSLWPLFWPMTRRPIHSMSVNTTLSHPPLPSSPQGNKTLLLLVMVMPSRARARCDNDSSNSNNNRTTVTRTRTRQQPGPLAAACQGPPTRQPPAPPPRSSASVSTWSSPTSSCCT